MVDLPAFIRAQLPEGGRSSFLWRRVIAAVRARAPALRIVAPDLVGLGLSTKPGMRAHTLANHGARLGHFLQTEVLADSILEVAALADWS